MKKSVTVFIFVLMFIANVSAQSPKENPTVIISDYALADRKLGIIELVKAYKNLEKEFSAEVEAFNSINLEIAKIDKELIARTKSVGGCVGSIDELIKEREKFAQASKQKAEDGKRRYDKRYLEIISPVLEKVDSALKEFEKVKGYKVIKLSYLTDDMAIDVRLICGDPDSDKTAEFIEFYNKCALVR